MAKETKGAVRDTAKPVHIQTGCALCDRGMLAPHKHRDTLIDAAGLNELAEQIKEVKNLQSFKIDPLFDHFDFEIPPLEKES